MDIEKREKLIKLGAEKLAETLMSLAERNDDVDERIDFIIMSREEKLKNIRRKIKGLNRLRKFIDWKGVRKFSKKLESIIIEITACEPEPVEVLELLAEFFKTDSIVFNICDDSSGFVGDVYTYSAIEQFNYFANLCEDKKKVAEILVDLVSVDEYGVRGCLVDNASEFLPEEIMRFVIVELKNRAKEKGGFDRTRIFGRISSIARQINDAELYVEVSIAISGKMSGFDYLELGKIYYETGRIDEAYENIKKAGEDGESLNSDYREYLLKIYKKQGKTDEMAEIQYTYFRKYPDKKTLDELIAVIGEEKREEVVQKKIDEIFAENDFHSLYVRFMISLDKLREAEDYIIKKSEHINGDYGYYQLAEIAEFLTEEKYLLGSTVIYRKLLDSILERVFNKGYSSGAKYLWNLDIISTLITDWKGLESHEDYKTRVYENNKRKTSFWGKYENLVKKNQR